MGAMAIKDAAESLAQKSPSGLEYCAISAAKVPAFAAVRVRLQNASFQLKTKHSKPVEAIVPMASGSKTMRAYCQRVAPSMRAASRISFGISLKPAYSIQTMIGKFASVKMMTNAVRLSSMLLLWANT